MEKFLIRNGCGRSNIRRADDGRNCLAKALAAALQAGRRECLTLITTKQKLDRLHGTFGGISKIGLLSAVLQHGRVAVVCEECHRAHFHDGATFAAVSCLFGTGHGQPEGLIYIGFTGTPGRSALRLFGQLEPSCADASSLSWQPAHCYHLGEAEEDEIVLDILQNYMDVDLESKAISAKAAYILKDLEESSRTYAPAFATTLKAMVVCQSRSDVVAYVLSLRHLLGSGHSVLPGGCLKSLGSTSAVCDMPR